MTALIALTITLTATSASASSPDPIEGIWTFNGGEVAIQADSQGGFRGTVITATKFAQCSHPVGEVMWSAIRAQADGSYWGLHQWYFETSACVVNPTLGPTAWRVISGAGGSRYLLVCFGQPGGDQPMIDASGNRSHVGYGCFKSAPVAPVPVESSPTSKQGVKSFNSAVSLPSAKKCFSRRVFQIHFKDPRYDPLKEVVVKIGSRTLKVRRHGNRFTSTVNLKGLPRGTFTVKVTATTVLGHHLAGRRTYHTCVSKKTHGRHGRRHSMRTHRAS